MRAIQDYEGWEGTIDELADAATRALHDLGQDESQAPNVRLIRDYAQRGILSPAERRGKEGYYGFQHLKELVAARVLVNEGVPLAKIAEQFERDRDIVIVTLGLGRGARPSAIAARGRWREIQQDSATPSVTAGESASAEFMRYALEGTGQSMDLQRTLRRLGVRKEEVVAQLVQLRITHWCSLLIETSRLGGISPEEEAEDIGRAVTALLSDPHIRKGLQP